jgi:hypothetical protein
VVAAVRTGDDRRKLAGGVVKIVNRQSQSSIDNLNRQSTIAKSAIYNPQAAIR